MTVPEAKVYLQQGYKLARDIRIKRERIRGLERCPDTEGLVEEFTREINGNIRAIQRIKKTITGVANLDYRHTLELHYVDGLEWAEVAATMGYTTRHIFRLQRKALEQICTQFQ